MPKADFIRSMFNDISSRYDLLNDILSLGLHRVWKNELIHKIKKINPKSFLDGATGTGDIALLYRAAAPNTKIRAIDFSPKMIEEAKKRSSLVDFEVNDLMNLSLDDKSYDASNVSFGIRNVEDYKLALSELNRVTKKGLFIMEFGQPQNKVIKKLYFALMKGLIPFIGKLFKKEEAYTYLIESSARFPSGDDFLAAMRERCPDFTYFKATALFFGIVYIYEAHTLDPNIKIQPKAQTEKLK